MAKTKWLSAMLLLTACMILPANASDKANRNVARKIMNEAVVQNYICPPPIHKSFKVEDVKTYDGKDILALVCMAEAEGESELGKRLVIDTILNRVDSPNFPNTVKEVVYQEGQFTSMWSGRSKRCKPTKEYYILVEEEIQRRTNSECVFFTAGTYSKYGTHMFKEGAHYFSRY